MKQKDIALFAVVAIVSAVFSVVLSNLFITPKDNKKMTAEKVAPITSQFNVPAVNDKYFNSNAINPTKLIEIGDGTNNKDPFKNTGN